MARIRGLAPLHRTFHREACKRQVAGHLNNKSEEPGSETVESLAHHSYLLPTRAIQKS